MFKKSLKKAGLLALTGAMSLGMMMSPTYAADGDETGVTLDTANSGFNPEEGRFDIYLTIDDTATRNVDIDLSDAIGEVLTQYAEDYLNRTSYPVYPGDVNPFKVYIRNESQITYGYQDSSFELETADYDGLTLSPYTGFDGKLIPMSYIAAIPASNPSIYNGIFGKDRGSEVTGEMMFQIYKYLDPNDQSNSQTLLTDYMLKYYNGFYGTTYETFDNLVVGMSGFADTFAVAGVNSLFDMTYADMVRYSAQNPRVGDYVFYDVINDQGTADVNDDIVRVQFKWPEEPLAALSYNAFYNDYFSFAYGDEMDSLEPNNSTAFTRTRGVGDYVDRSSELYEQTNDYFSTLENADSLENGEVLEFDMKFGIDGPAVGNGYQNYKLSFYNAISLQQINTEYTVEHHYYTSIDGGEYVLDGSVLSDPIDGVLGDQISGDDIEKLLTYDENTYEVYSVSDDIVLVVGEENKIIIEYRRDVTTPTPPPEDEVLGDTEEPEDPEEIIVPVVEDEVLGDTDAPDTSDAIEFGIVSLGLIAGAMGIVALRKRKES